jgi:hypothetical protein
MKGQKPGAPADEGMMDLARQIGQKAFNGFKSLGDAPFEAVDALNKLLGGHPKMAGVTPPKDVSASENMPNDNTTGAMKPLVAEGSKKVFNRRKFLRGEEE